MTNGNISTYGYVNNAIGNRVSMSRSGSVFPVSDLIGYTYNDRSELIGASSNAENGSYQYSYAFDPIGNRLTATKNGAQFSYTANQLNQYTAINEMEPAYDADGNMASHNGWTYAWNGENRLVKAEKDGIRLEFAYDYILKVV